MHTGLLRAIPCMRYVLASYAVSGRAWLQLFATRGQRALSPFETLGNIEWGVALCTQGHLRCTQLLQGLPVDLLQQHCTGWDMLCCWPSQEIITAPMTLVTRLARPLVCRAVSMK